MKTTHLQDTVSWGGGSGTVNCCSFKLVFHPEYLRYPVVQTLTCHKQHLLIVVFIQRSHKVNYLTCSILFMAHTETGYPIRNVSYMTVHSFKNFTSFVCLGALIGLHSVCHQTAGNILLRIRSSPAGTVHRDTFTMATGHHGNHCFCLHNGYNYDMQL